jgi:hypothetical protein
MKTNQRKTWVPHGINGFYLGPAMEHYRCRHVYCSSIGQERIVDTIEFMPQNFKVPGISSAEAVVIAASDLTHTLLHPAPTAPFQQPGSDRMQAIKELSAILDRMMATHEPPPRVPTVMGTAAQHAPQAPSPRVPMSVPNIRRSPRQHQPAIISQKETGMPILSNTAPTYRTGTCSHRSTHGTAAGIPSPLKMTRPPHCVGKGICQLIGPPCPGYKGYKRNGFDRVHNAGTNTKRHINNIWEISMQHPASHSRTSQSETYHGRRQNRLPRRYCHKKCRLDHLKMSLEQHHINQ